MIFCVGMKKASEKAAYDEKFLRQVQNIIHSEIALVMEISLDEVAPYIEKTINAA